MSVVKEDRDFRNTEYRSDFVPKRIKLLTVEDFADFRGLRKVPVNERLKDKQEVADQKITCREQVDVRMGNNQDERIEEEKKGEQAGEAHEGIPAPWITLKRIRLQFLVDVR